MASISIIYQLVILYVAEARHIFLCQKMSLITSISRQQQKMLAKAKYSEGEDVFEPAMNLTETGVVLSFENAGVIVSFENA